MLVNISDAFPLDTLISRPQIWKNPHDIYPDTGGYYADGRLIETGRARLARNGPTHGSDVPPIVHPRPTVRDRISARG